MLRFRITAVAALLTPLWGSAAALAHPGHPHHEAATPAKSSHSDYDHDRLWTTAYGQTLGRGSFVMAKNGRVQIRLADDSLFDEPTSRLAEADRVWIDHRQARIRQANEAKEIALLAPDHALDTHLNLDIASGNPGNAIDAPSTAKPFEAFVKLGSIKTHWDERYLYVESNGIPDHRMMVGIRSWQQQVPIPQKYFGDNAWRIPLHPVPAIHPKSTNGSFLRGAIAIAANGIPIFNPLNNRGDDAYLFGELDEFGGHCGRADDYHYHLAPLHLAKKVGDGLPVAYALDGYPIFGLNEPNGAPAQGLDRFNGHDDAKTGYHYHASTKYPYLNGGFHGEVTERDGQVDPQPRAEPLRPSLTPLRDAKITDFRELQPKSFLLTYDVRGREGTVRYTLNQDGSARFVFNDPNNRAREETYQPMHRSGARPPRHDERQPPPPPNDRLRMESRRDSNLPHLTVTSPSVNADGMLSIDCSCDGAGQSPAVEWRNAPPGTQSFAISLWHTAPDREKSYWVVYRIPADVAELKRNSKTVGVIGINDRQRAEYDPICSQGPGVKVYHLTVYALSAVPKLPLGQANRAGLLRAIKDITLAEGTVDLRYERKR